MRHLSIVVAGMLALVVPQAAQAANCRPPCGGITTSVKAASIFEGPDNFRTRGDVFLTAANPLALSGDRTSDVALGFDFRIGSNVYSTITVHENGFVSFAAPAATRAAATGFVPVSNLAELGVPVIAPFYADLAANAVPGRFIGDVTVQTGLADPYDNGGGYSRDDLQRAIWITWYGVALADGTGSPVYAQLMIAGDGRDTNSFEFRYGPPDSPGQAGYGSIAGFALGADAYQYRGDRRTGVPTYFELNDGRLVGDFAAGGVPEPATWGMLLLGFAFVGGALRRAEVRQRVRAPA